MTDAQKEWNKKSLIAWNQWKEICSICGCPDTDRHILMVEVSNAFQRKLRSVVGKQLDSLFSDYYVHDVFEEENQELDVLPSQLGTLPSEGDYYSDDFDGGGVARTNSLEDFIPSEELDDSRYDDEQLDSSDSNKRTPYYDDDAYEDVSNEAAENQNRNIKKEKQFRVDWAHEFDCGIIEKAKSPTSPKNYKDHTWECISRSNDKPLKVIRGQLLGPVSIINEIAERFLRRNYPQIWEKQLSLQMPLENAEEDGSETLEDLIEKKEPDSLDQTDKTYLRESFENAFSKENAAIFLVYLTGFSPLFPRKLSISTPELLSFVGLDSASPLYDRLNNVILPTIQKFPEECLQAISVPGASEFLISLMIEQIKPEKKAIPLLQCIKDKMVKNKD